MAEITTDTAPGHETNYRYTVKRDGVTYHINASNPSGIDVRYGGTLERFHNLKSALNFALGALD